MASVRLTRLTAMFIVTPNTNKINPTNKNMFFFPYAFKTENKKQCEEQKQTNNKNGFLCFFVFLHVFFICCCKHTRKKKHILFFGFFWVSLGVTVNMNAFETLPWGLACPKVALEAGPWASKKEGSPHRGRACYALRWPALPSPPCMYCMMPVRHRGYENELERWPQHNRWVGELRMQPSMVKIIAAPSDMWA